MKKVWLNDTEYVVEKKSGHVQLDGYFYNGTLYFKKPKLTTSAGIICTEEGVYDIRHRKRILMFLVAILVALVLKVGVYAMYTASGNIMYNPEPVLDANGYVNIQYINGDRPAKVRLRSRTAVTRTYEVRPYQHLQQIALGFTPTAANYPMILSVECSGVVKEFPITVRVKTTSDDDVILE